MEKKAEKVIIPMSFSIKIPEIRTEYRGFSLLELGVVLFIIAILLGFALPNFSNYLDSDLERESQKIAEFIDRLRTQAVLESHDYILVFDTKKSEYQAFTLDAQNSASRLPNETFPNPIKLVPPIEIKRVSTDTENETFSKFGFKKLEFDKIFGQRYEFKIDSSGFIDIFSLQVADKKNSITVSVDTIMGDISIGHEVPL